MRQTSIRFGHDLWALLEEEAGLVGVSVSQYIREAALARATAAAVARGQGPFELLAGACRPSVEPEESDETGARVESRATTIRSDARALRGQSRQAKAMAGRAQSRNKALRSQTPPPRAS